MDLNCNDVSVQNRNYTYKEQTCNTKTAITDSPINNQGDDQTNIASGTKETNKSKSDRSDPEQEFIIQPDKVKNILKP